MILRRPREFLARLGTIEELIKYLKEDLVSNFKDIEQVFRALTFEDNFKGWVEHNITIAASSEVGIANRITPNIPSKRIILRASSPDICDGSTAWSESKVYLKNTSGSAVTCTVAFLK